jgi:predicted O-linked N-acetylglucosamine transferase (SPINDLY family)
MPPIAIDSIPAALETIEQLWQSGDFPAVDSLCRQILALDPHQVRPLHLLGMLEFRNGHPNDSIQFLTQALALAPADANIPVDLGNAFLAIGQFDQAIASFRRAIALCPNHMPALNNLALALQKVNCLDEAIAVLRQVVSLRPDLPAQQAALAYALYKSGRLPDAIEGYHRALALNPNDIKSLTNLAYALSECFRAEESLAVFAKLLVLRPDDADVHKQMAHALLILDRPDQAVAAVRRAIQLRPDFAEAHGLLGNALRDCGQIDAAIAAYRQAVALRPDLPDLASKLVYALHFDPRYDPDAILAEHKEWNRHYADPLAKLIPTHRNDRSAHRRLRIGYISSDFRNHVVGFNLLPLFRHHDHTRFNITCYSSVIQPDQTTEIFRSLSDEWRHIVGFDAQEVARSIIDDKIDILIDLSLHMERNWLLVFARKPAPIQLTFAGYPGTTGLTAIDYRLTDPYLDPPGPNDAFYSEQSIRLPNCFWCYTPSGTEPPTNPLPATVPGHVTFGCLNTFGKVNDTTLQLWSGVLAAVPKSKLLLLAPPGEPRTNVLAKLKADPDRIEFLDRALRAKYLQYYHRIDISLDTFPYNGHTTSLDSWWMGVPVVTLCGQTAVSRAGFSHASNLALTDLVAHSPDQFVSIAAKLADDLPRLTELRSTLRTRMKASPLMNAAAFAHDIETAYRQMWRRWRESSK